MSPSTSSRRNLPLVAVGGSVGSADGVGGAAQFSGQTDLATDRAGNVYVGDRHNYIVRKITPDGTVTTLAGSPGQQGSTDGIGSAARFNTPVGVAVDALGNVWIADRGKPVLFFFFEWPGSIPFFVFEMFFLLTTFSKLLSRRFGVPSRWTHICQKNFCSSPCSKGRPTNGSRHQMTRIDRLFLLSTNYFLADSASPSRWTYIWQ